jgi:hypothetical protein
MKAAAVPKTQNPPPAAQPHASVVPLLQRQCTCGGAPGVSGECAECEQAKLRHKANGSDDMREAPAIVGDVLRSSGRPLEASARNFFESRFGHDFSRVRIHDDARASESARAVNARAYTVGSDVVFGAGLYAPQSEGGRRLLAHELAHVTQQGNVARPSFSSLKVGPANDAFEHDADRAAERISTSSEDRVPSAGRRPADARVSRASQGAAILQRDAARDEEELQSIAKAGERARQDPRNPTNVTISGAQIVYRLIAKFYPEVSSRLSGVGADTRLGDAIIADVGRDNSVSITVGPAFVLRTQRQALDLQRMRIRRALEVAGAIPKLSFQDALAEGAAVLRQAGFGTVCGEATGRDPGDGFDASEWREIGFEKLEATVVAWIAMDHLIKNLGRPVPKAGGGTTKWKFDCFGFVGLNHVYALWRTLPADEFNKKFSPLQLGTQGSVNLQWEEPMKSSKPGEAPYRLGEIKLTPRGGMMAFEPEKKPVGKSWAQLLKEAPIGSQVIWGNLDAQQRCREITLPGSETGRNAAVCAWAYENTTKVGEDKFSAHPLGKLTPLGILSAKRVKEEMSKAVNDGRVPPGYVEKNIYIDGMRFPKKNATVTT